MSWEALGIMALLAGYVLLRILADDIRSGHSLFISATTTPQGWRFLARICMLSAGYVAHAAGCNRIFDA